MKGQNETPVFKVSEWSKKRKIHKKKDLGSPANLENIILKKFIILAQLISLMYIAFFLRIFLIVFFNYEILLFKNLTSIVIKRIEFPSEIPSIRQKFRFKSNVSMIIFIKILTPFKNITVVKRFIS